MPFGLVLAPFEDGREATAPLAPVQAAVAHHPVALRLDATFLVEDERGLRLRRDAGRLLEETAPLRLRTCFFRLTGLSEEMLHFFFALALAGRMVVINPQGRPPHRPVAMRPAGLGAGHDPANPDWHPVVPVTDGMELGAALAASFLAWQQQARGTGARA